MGHSEGLQGKIGRTERFVLCRLLADAASSCTGLQHFTLTALYLLIQKASLVHASRKDSDMLSDDSSSSSLDATPPPLPLCDPRFVLLPPPPPPPRLLGPSLSVKPPESVPTLPTARPPPSRLPSPPSRPPNPPTAEPLNRPLPKEGNSDGGAASAGRPGGEAVGGSTDDEDAGATDVTAADEDDEADADEAAIANDDDDTCSNPSVGADRGEAWPPPTASLGRLCMSPNGEEAGRADCRAARGGEEAARPAEASGL